MKVGNKDMNIILENLNERRDYDQFDEMNIEDVLVIHKRGRLEDAISVGLEKKYSKALEKFGDLTVNVDIGLTDIDDYNLEDVADEISIGFAFDSDNLDQKEVIREIKKIVKSFKGYDVKYDKSCDDFMVSLEGQEDITELIDRLERDGCKLKGFYKIIDSEDIRNDMRNSYDEYKANREYLEREFRRNAL